jgi:hypothetical protein
MWPVYTKLDIVGSECISKLIYNKQFKSECLSGDKGDILTAHIVSCQRHLNC